MPIYKMKLLSRREVAQDTFIFTFEKPADLQFIPGQYGGFTLINPQEKDAGGSTRRFSLLSTPDDKELSIITRIQHSAFKRELKKLPLQEEIKFAGPTGNFILHEDSSMPAVMLAGGMGIAPFYSIIRYATAHQLPQRIYLFYGNAILQHAALMEELNQLQKENPYFTFIPTLEQAPSSWQGETGFITYTMIKKHVPDIATSMFYVCGGPAMVTALQELLQEMDVAAEHIRVEDFPGY